jgi:hypothetical protein
MQPGNAEGAGPSPALPGTLSPREHWNAGRARGEGERAACVEEGGSFVRPHCRQSASSRARREKRARSEPTRTACIPSKRTACVPLRPASLPALPIATRGEGGRQAG